MLYKLSYLHYVLPEKLENTPKYTAVEEWLDELQYFCGREYGATI